MSLTLQANRITPQINENITPVCDQPIRTSIGAKLKTTLGSIADKFGLVSRCLGSKQELRSASTQTERGAARLTGRELIELPAELFIKISESLMRREDYRNFLLYTNLELHRATNQQPEFKSNADALCDLKNNQWNLANCTEFTQKNARAVLETIDKLNLIFRKLDNQHSENATFHMSGLEHFFGEVNKAQALHSGLYSIHPTLKNDEKFMKRVLTAGERNHAYLGEQLKNDEQFLSWMVSKYPRLYSQLNETMRSNPTLLLSMYKTSRALPHSNIGDHIKSASDTLKKDEKTMCELVRLAPLLLAESVYKYAHDDLRNNPDFSEFILDIQPELISSAPQSIRGNERIVCKVLAKNPSLLRHMDERFKDIPELAKSAVSYAEKNRHWLPVMQHNNTTEAPYDLSHIASERLLDDHEFALFVLKCRSEENSCSVQAPPRISPLFYFSERLKNNLEIASIAASIDRDALKFAGSDLRRNPDFIKLALEPLLTQR